MIRTNNLLNRSTTPVKLIVELFCSNESFWRFEKDRRKVLFSDSKKKDFRIKTHWTNNTVYETKME